MSGQTPDDWTDQQNNLFSRLLRFTSENQKHFMRPGCHIPQADWDVLCWNLSWMAAAALDEDSEIVICDAETEEEITREPNTGLMN